MTRSQQRLWARRLLAGALAVTIVGAVSAGVVFGYLSGRGEITADAERDSPVAPPIRVTTAGGQTTVTLDDAEIQNGGIRTAAIEAVSGKAQIQAFGAVLDPQPLTDLSNNYTTARDQLQTAEAKLAASRLAYERAQRLYQDQQNVSAAQLQTAEAAYRVDEANTATARTQAENIASSASQQWGTVLGAALVDRSTMFLRLLARQDVLIQVTLPPGQSVASPPVNATAQPAGSRPVTISYVSPAPRTDSRIQGISFYYIAPAASGLLPGMNLNVMLPSGSNTGQLVPGSAVLWLDGRAWAWVKTSAHSFVRRPVSTDKPLAGGYVIQNIPIGSELVMQGGQLLLSEEFRAQIQIED